MPIGCTHTHSEEEDKLYHYLPFNQLYTGYGWGSSPQSTADGVTVINYFYMITYYDDHGDVLRVEYVTDGQSDDTHNIANEKNITYTPATSDAEFLGWVNKGASSVTSIPIGNRNDIELFATYAGSFYARFYDENGNVIQSVEIKKADDARSLVNVAGPASSSEYLAFDHWEVREVDKNGVVTTTDLATYIDSLVKNNDNFKGSHSDVAIYPYYAINTGLGLTPVDTDGDGVVNYYTVEAVNGSNFGTVLTIPGEVNGVPVKIITDLTSTWADNVEHIIVKDGVEEIGEGAFQQTKNLHQLELPTSIIKIGKNAFTAKWGHEGKDKDLVIIYNGTKEQWDAIEKESGWSYNLPEDTIIQCLDGYYQKGKKNSDNWTWNPTNN